MADPRSGGERAPLRVTDWRFLLPHPPDGQFQHLIVLGGTDALTERVLELGLARRVSATLPPARSADAAVVLHRSHTGLREIARALAPGGVLYYEVDRRSRGYRATAPARLRRELREADLSAVAMYAVTPDFIEPRMYLPLDVPGALRWYVETRYSVLTPWQDLLQLGLRAVTDLDGRRFVRFTPRLAVTAAVGQGRTAVPSVLDPSALPPRLHGRHLRPLLLTFGGDRVVVLPFGEDSTEPAAVLKIPKLPGFSSRTENEQATLHDLWSRLDPTLRSSVPRPLGLFRYGQVIAAAESYASGELLYRSSEHWGLSRHQRLTDLHLAAAWLGEFHRQTLLCRPPWGPRQLSQWVEEPLDAYRRAFGLTAPEERLFGRAREYADSLAGMSLPVVLQHRDFTVWNIARRGRTLAVLDWEGARPGPALCDLLHFVIHWYETVRHAHDEPARQRCFRRLLFEWPRGDSLHTAVHRTVEGYLTRLDMSRRFLPLLLVYTWVELALRRADQQQLQREGQLQPRTDNRYAALVAILAQHTAQLFPTRIRDGAAAPG